jgi:hypothetical protein
VLSIAACFNPVLCAAANGGMALMSMADRTYEFVNSGEYKDGALAWGGYALGMGFRLPGRRPRRRRWRPRR